MNNDLVPSPKKPKEQFRGWHIPVEIVRLFQSGVIDAFDTLLLATIDSLVSEKKGCWASNKFLAEKMGKKKGERKGEGEDIITRRIGKLKRLKLLKQVGFDGRKRTLITVWSRMKTREKVQISLGKNPEADREKIPRRTLVSKISKQELSAKADNAVKPAEHVEVPDLLNGDFSSKGAERLMAVLAKNNSDLVQPPVGKRRPVTLKTLAKNFDHLTINRGIERARIIKVVKWLKNPENYNDKWTPKIREAMGFAAEFKRIEEAMENKLSEGSNGRGDKVQPGVAEEAGWRMCNEGKRVWVPKGRTLYQMTFDHEDMSEEESTFDDVQRRVLKTTKGRQPTQEDVDAVLEVLGLKPGSIDCGRIGR